MKSKLNLNRGLVDQGRKLAKSLADGIQGHIDTHTTVTNERTICRLLGIDGVNDVGVPLPNVVVDQLVANQVISTGVAVIVGNATVKLGLTPQEIAEKIAGEDLNICTLPMEDMAKIRAAIEPVADATLARIKANREKRDELLKKYKDDERNWPLLYLMVATGNIYEDIVQATAAARQGAEVIAVIRTTGQSLLDYVPYGATTDGFGGTAATQENFRLMREALDKVGEEVGRYVRLCNYASGLCMPEISAMGALERLDFMLNDSLYGILFRDINMKRTMVDQFFSRAINGYAGIVINTGEDNYLTTADAVDEAHTVLASHFLNEEFALRAGLPPKLIGLGGAFEISPDVHNGFLYEVAQTQLEREIFPDAPNKYMPPTKYMTGNIFKGNMQNTLYNLVSVMTHQGICLLGMQTEAIHTPFMSDRSIALENAMTVFNTAANFGDEITFVEGGIIQRRAEEVLQKAVDLLTVMDKDGLFESIAKGVFGNVKRPVDGGKGLAGVYEKGEGYFNPFLEKIMKGAGVQ